VLCRDEKSQCQAALERTQRALPLAPGKRATRTHDCIRHGTITLFTALDYLEGRIFSNTQPRHTHVEWLRFLKQLDRQCPRALTLHLILDNYATHKKEEVTRWIERLNARPQKNHRCDRIILHFTPASGSWLNLVERFFADITREAISRESFSSLRELVRRIEDCLAQHNLNPKRYVWQAKGEEVLRKIKAAKDALKSEELLCEPISNPGY